MAKQGRPRRSPARLLAPIALVATVGAVAYVVSNSTGNDDGGDSNSANRTVEPRPRENGRRQRRPQRTFYRVRLNDTLGLIAEQTGVPVERLEALNPELDPQNLIVGQRIRLRE
jgi:LysM repeat protein